MELTINHPPKFQSRYGHGKPVARYIDAVLQARLDQQQQFLTDLSAVHDGLASINIEEPDDSMEPRWRQSWMPPLDGISIYGAIARRRPSVYLEVGSGNSTKFAAKAIRDLNLDTKIISIDPQPRAEIDDLATTIVRQPLEEIDLEIFDQISDGDVVFFDGSHRCLQNSDVTVFFIDVLPMLKTNTLVGIHDIFWPYDYSEKWVTRYYSEQYVVGAYMLALGEKFPCVFSSAYMFRKHLDAVVGALPAALNELFENNDLQAKGACLWFEKPQVSFGTHLN